MDAEHKALVLEHGPVGLWRTSAGSADVLGVDDVRFDPDGTGLITTRSVLFGTEDVPFLWAVDEPGRLRVRVQAEQDDPEEDDEPDFWGSVRLEFRRQHHDLGEEEILCEAGRNGFWWLDKPLRWVGPVSTP